jgi:hypothetical protein
MSKTVQKYLKAYEHQWEDEDNVYEFIDMTNGVKLPLFIGMHFVRGTRHKYDWINMCQGVQDLMVKYGWIEDDNTEIMYPVPLAVNNCYSSYDKENPGVYIEIIK